MVRYYIFELIPVAYEGQRWTWSHGSMKQDVQEHCHSINISLKIYVYQHVSPLAGEQGPENISSIQAFLLQVLSHTRTPEKPGITIHLHTQHSHKKKQG